MTARKTPCQQLTERLETLGYKVHDIVLPTGHYRSSPYADVVRWIAHVSRDGGMRFSIASWDTVTACARRGFDISGEGPSGHIEAHAKGSP